MALTGKISTFLISAAVLITTTSASGAKDFFPDYVYLEKKKDFSTFLLRTEPSPQKTDFTSRSKMPLGGELILYESEGAKLFGVLFRSNIKGSPTIVVIHGGFAMSGPRYNQDHFIRAGYNVFMPTFRGANGNPGFFEFMLGEADDAAAAIKEIAKDPQIDPTKIYVFGHSVGGAISALLALRDDLPVRMTASSGGLYPRNVFRDWWSDDAPFDRSEPIEAEMRLMMHHADELKIKHIGYLGQEDSVTYGFIDSYGYPPFEGVHLLEIYSPPGDHMDAWTPSIQHFILLIEKDNNNQ